MPLHQMMGSVCHLIPLAIPVPENDTFDCASGYPIPATGTANWDLITHLLFQIWHRFQHIAGTPGIFTYKSYCGLQFSCKSFLRERQFDHLPWRATRGNTRGWRKIWERGGCVCVCVRSMGGVWTMLCNICPVPRIPIGLLEDTLYNLNRGTSMQVWWVHNTLVAQWKVFRSRGLFVEDKLKGKCKILPQLEATR